MSLVYLDLCIICTGVGFIMYNVYNNFTKREEKLIDKVDIDQLEADYEDYLYVEKSENKDDHIIKKRKRKSI